MATSSGPHWESKHHSRVNPPGGWLDCTPRTLCTRLDSGGGAMKQNDQISEREYQGRLKGLLQGAFNTQIGALHRDCEDTSGRAAAARFFLVDALLGSFGTETADSPPEASSIVGSASISRSAAFKCSMISYDSSCDSTRRQAVRPNSSDPA